MIAKVAMGKMYIRAVHRCDTWKRFDSPIYILRIVCLKEWVANGGVALDGNGKSEIDASRQTHLSHRQQDWNLAWNTY